MRLAAALLVLLGFATQATADEAVWAVLKGGGNVVMIRHATAPGTYDPPGMRLDDCATQRNLDAHGRDEARRIGAAFRTRGIPVARVLSSQWCRCIETAELAFGPAERWEPLNSLAESPQLDARRTAEVRRFVTTPFTGGNVVLVTHNFNIRALTGVTPQSGEMVILKPRGHDRFDIAGRLAPSALTVRP